MKYVLLAAMLRRHGVPVDYHGAKDLFYRFAFGGALPARETFVVNEWVKGYIP